jgi:hypothetical protein
MVGLGLVYGWSRYGWSRVGIVLVEDWSRVGLELVWGWFGVRIGSLSGTCFRGGLRLV